MKVVARLRKQLNTNWTDIRQNLIFLKLRVGKIKSSNRHGCAYPAETRIRPSSLPVAPRRTALNFSNVITKIRQQQISPCTWVILAAQSTCRLPLGWGAPLFSPPTSSHFQTGLWLCRDDCLAPPYQSFVLWHMNWECNNARMQYSRRLAKSLYSLASELLRQ